ncbi:MAG: aldehyde dehydrogenase family protein [Aromatoleum sp.]|jgi:aldehyde dehydrogenase (NAD+)/betaine-aldehyde dehydrogenase|uniref:aldehyde dehydrogenase family protein n=1 Tax=Aromatoleum sp. TaxID=2307007 RepID=UPI002894DBDD|nr:aldehyde dehydrogenase family protein [Aromatoleum sp.]MDT3672478.1 aldehyde dehydrogenase family protein [Aromatoleum sp.]
MTIVRDKLFIGGQWVAPQGAGFIDVIDPSDASVYARVPEGAPADAETAVAAARDAFDAWSRTSPADRAAYIDRIAEGFQARSDELAHAIAHEVGMPLKLAARVQVAGPLGSWRRYAKLAREFEWEARVGTSLVVREPVGVVGAITPWNFPLNQITLKVAPALAAGCTVVLKPSEVAPINAFILAEIIAEAGLPAGVFNLVTGYGPVVGEVLASDPRVDMVSFTGSTRAGKRVAELAAATVKKVALELGGKSASVVLDDADLAAAVKGTVSNCLLNSGQTCSAQTRMIVPRAKLDEAARLAAAAASSFTVGPALADGSRLGPLVSAVQRDRVVGYIRRGVAEGAKLVAGGADAAPAGEGFFVAPTVLVVDDAKATIAQEEVFGPVLVILPHDGDDDAVAIANDSIYGLGGGVWAGSDEHGLAVARRIRTGQVDVNGAPWNPLAPFGGYRQSGLGRENGVYGLEEFLEYKAIQLRAD